MTDVRGGGLLSVQCLDAFATLHTMGLKAMLLDIRDLELRGNDAFYPVSTTAIVLCARLCDACGLSAGMRGPIKPEQLEALLAAPPPTEFARDCWSMLPDRQRRGGFAGIFALLRAAFHVRFVLMRASYMQAQTLVDTVLAVLARRLAVISDASTHGPHTVRSPKAGGGRRARASMRESFNMITRGQSTRASSRYTQLLDMYSQPDAVSDAGATHARDVHALLTATEMRRATSVKILRKAIGMVALQAQMESVRESAMSEHAPKIEPNAADLEVANASSDATDDAPIEVLEDMQAASNGGATASRGGTPTPALVGVLRALETAREEEMAEPLTPMEMSLPTSTALRMEKVQTNVAI